MVVQCLVDIKNILFEYYMIQIQFLNTKYIKYKFKLKYILTLLNLEVGPNPRSGQHKSVYKHITFTLQTTTNDGKVKKLTVEDLD